MLSNASKDRLNDLGIEIFVNNKAYDLTEYNISKAVETFRM